MVSHWQSILSGFVFFAFHTFCLCAGGYLFVFKTQEGKALSSLTALLFVFILKLSFLLLGGLVLKNVFSFNWGFFVVGATLSLFFAICIFFSLFKT